MSQHVCRVEGQQAKMIYLCFHKKSEMKIEGKEIHGMTQNKILGEVLEDIKMIRKNWQEKSKRKDHGEKEEIGDFLPLRRGRRKG
jgi:hypothetical protein